MPLVMTNRMMREVYMRATPDDEEPFDPDAFMERSAVALMRVMEERGANVDELLELNPQLDPNAIDPEMDAASTVAARKLQAIARRRRRPSS